MASTGLSTYVIDKRISKILKYVNIKNKTGLDVGCGNGKYAISLARIARKVIGIDYRIDNIKEAERNKELLNLNNIQFEYMLATELDFPEKTFDIVLLNEVYEHLIDPEKALSEISRVLKDDGFLVLFVPNRFYPIEGHGFRFKNFRYYRPITIIHWLPESIHKHLMNARTFTPKSLIKELHSYGFSHTALDWLLPTFDYLFKNSLGSKIHTILRRFSEILENSFFRRFGMSIILITKKMK
ncbi:MAG: class I SAM-dependent methyltransferase [Candidatus Helarchaeota archaeon]